MNQFEPQIEFKRWEIDSIDDDDIPPAESPFAEIRKINGALLSGPASIIKTGDKFALSWKERHPEMVAPKDYFANEGITGIRALSEEEITEWSDLEQAMPAKTYEIELTRTRAFGILAYYWLPSEFNDDVEAL